MGYWVWLRYGDGYKVETMNNINPIELGLACIVLIGYIWGKLWIWYKVETDDTKDKKGNKG